MPTARCDPAVERWLRPGSSSGLTLVQHPAGSLLSGHCRLLAGKAGNLPRVTAADRDPLAAELLTLAALLATAALLTGAALLAAAARLAAAALLPATGVTVTRLPAVMARRHGNEYGYRQHGRGL